jgi:hypothetical protein
MSTRLSLGSALAFTSRRAIRTFGLLWVILAGSPALGSSLGMVTPDQWLPHETVGVLDRVTVRVHWFETLAALRTAASERDVSARFLQGFSVLSRNKETGAYSCDVFVVKMGGSLVDKDRTVTFGHEVLHCFGLSHE